jgi:hypothetical protein
MPQGRGFARRVTLANVQTFAPLLRSVAHGEEAGGREERSGEEIDLDQANATPGDPALAAAEALFAGEPLQVRTAHRRRGRTRSQPNAASRSREPDSVESNRPSADLAALVAEIPRAAGRWNQANFDLSTYEGFFGARIGEQRTIQLQHVGTDGTLGPLERRPSVEVKSRNFRFELEAASGLPYPPQGRPIAIFVRQASGSFLYRLLLPADPQHASLVRFLDEKWTGRSDRMRRVQTTIRELREYWPESPMWQAV